MKATATLSNGSGIFQRAWILALLLSCGGAAVGSIGVKLARNQKTGQVRGFEAPPGTGQRAGLAGGGVILALGGKRGAGVGNDEQKTKAPRGGVGDRR